MRSLPFVPGDITISLFQSKPLLKASFQTNSSIQVHQMFYLGQKLLVCGFKGSHGFLSHEKQLFSVQWPTCFLRSHALSYQKPCPKYALETSWKSVIILLRNEKQSEFLIPSHQWSIKGPCHWIISESLFISTVLIVCDLMPWFSKLSKNLHNE